ncbi:hypothetical protein [Clostridium cochlearium]|uniref:hypothetical protein n=1 Tax=Clostridium cochlearium TaxID=1494 RepID=UPI001A9BFEB4|nr:hypothetical protein [Clostridium cochlearium]
MSNIKIEEIDYKSIGRCLRIYNNEVELYVTLEMGPRIIRYGFIGYQNEFCEDVPTTKKVLEEEWKMIGGHRFWHSPEHNLRTYIPDNKKVKWSKIEDTIILENEVEPWSQIKKEIQITLNNTGSNVTINHRLINKNAWAIEISAWALTVMAPGGIEIIPQCKKNTNLLPDRLIALWPYSKMNDPRISFGDKYIALKQNKNKKDAFKIGILNREGWAAYFNHNNIFIKEFTNYEETKYPDFGVSYESYTNEFMLEMESLSPLTMLEPEGVLNHVENWKLVKGLPFPGYDEEKLDSILGKVIKEL